MAYVIVAIIGLIIFAVSVAIVSFSIHTAGIDEYSRPMKYVWECYDAWGDVWYSVATDPDDACREGRSLTSIRRHEPIPYWDKLTHTQQLHYIERYKYNDG